MVNVVKKRVMDGLKSSYRIKLSYKLRKPNVGIPFIISIDENNIKFVSIYSSL